MKRDRWTKMDCEIIWLHGLTDWWPDSINLPGDNPLIAGVGYVGACMPERAERRIENLRNAGERYVRHISPGVHAHRIGYASEYFTDCQIDALLTAVRGES